MIIQINDDTWVNPHHICGIRTADGPTILLTIGGHFIQVEKTAEDVAAEINEAIAEVFE